MLDIFFNTEIRDIVPTDNGLELTANPSTQNGAILLEARDFNLTNPIYGIGITQIIGGDLFGATKEMNRWVSQVAQDGGQCTWQYTGNNTPDFPFTSTVQYPLT